VEPGYEQRHFAAGDGNGSLKLLVSPEGRDGSLRMHADASLYMARLGASDSIPVALNPARKAYLHLMCGTLQVNGQALAAGDAVLVENESLLQLDKADGAQILLFDLAA